MNEKSDEDGVEIDIINDISKLLGGPSFGFEGAVDEELYSDKDENNNINDTEKPKYEAILKNDTYNEKEIFSKSN